MSRGRKETRLYRLIDLRAESDRLARKMRRMIFKALGRICRNCGTKQRLEFDHPTGRTWKADQYSGLTRIRMYWKDFKKRKLSVLCRHCNASIGQKFRKDRQKPKPKGECHAA
jgi:hypothetical protein